MFFHPFVYNIILLPNSFSRRAFHCDVWNQVCKIPNLHVQIRVSQLRRDLQQCGLQNCHQETRPYRKEVRKEFSQVSLVRPSVLFAFQHAWEHASMFLFAGSFSHRCFHMFPLFQHFCLQGQMEELDLTPTYKQCPDAQEGMPVQGFIRIISSMFTVCSMLKWTKSTIREPSKTTLC